MLKSIHNFFKIDIVNRGDINLSPVKKKQNIKLKAGATTFHLHLVDGTTLEIYSANHRYLSALVNTIHQADRTETIVLEKNDTLVIQQITGQKRTGHEINQQIIFDRDKLALINFPEDCQPPPLPPKLPVESAVSIHIPGKSTYEKANPIERVRKTGSATRKKQPAVSADYKYNPVLSDKKLQDFSENY